MTERRDHAAHRNAERGAETCGVCGEPLWFCPNLCLEEIRSDREEEQESCGCGFCHCENASPAGATCAQCLAGAHQG